MGLERLFQIVGLIFGLSGVYFMYSNHRDGAFVSVVLCICAFFLSYRFKLKAELERDLAESDESPESKTDA
jgi:uncharacterized membrane protein